MTEDLKHLKAKVDAGAEYIVTQMFFNNEHYFRFVDNCRAMGILRPDHPGAQILSSQRQLSVLPKTFGASCPKSWSPKLARSTPKTSSRSASSGRSSRAKSSSKKGRPRSTTTSCRHAIGR